MTSIVISNGIIPAPVVIGWSPSNLTLPIGIHCLRWISNLYHIFLNVRAVRFPCVDPIVEQEESFVSDPCASSFQGEDKIMCFPSQFPRSDCISANETSIEHFQMSKSCVATKNSKNSGHYTLGGLGSPCLWK